MEDVPEPKSIKPDEIRIRPTWCGICGTDLHEYKAGPIVIPTKPHPLTAAVLIAGVGPIGALAVVAAAAGASRVFISEPNPHRAEFVHVEKGFKPLTDRNNNALKILVRPD